MSPDGVPASELAEARFMVFPMYFLKGFQLSLVEMDSQALSGILLQQEFFKVDTLK
jgi:hypothetical protein